MDKITNILLGITTLFILGIMTVPAYADSGMVCNESHVPVERTNGKMACLTEKTAEMTVERFGWVIISASEFTLDEMDIQDFEFTEHKETITIKSESIKGGHGSQVKYLRPANVTLEIPSSIQLGQIFSIDYDLTFDFEQTDFDDFADLLDRHPKYPLAVFIPDEFSPVTDPDKRFLLVVDQYDKHGMYTTVFYLEDIEDLSGSIEFRLDKPMFHDLDDISINTNQGFNTYFGIEKTDMGVIFTQNNRTKILHDGFDDRYNTHWDGPLSTYVPSERYAESVTGVVRTPLE